MKSFHLLILLTLVAACATHDASTEWDLVDDSPDPLDHEGSDDDDSPDGLDLSDDLDDATDDDEPVARTCSELDLDNWDPDDFAFELFHYFSCRRPADENLVFSPTLARLTLIELAEELGGAEGDEIAALLGAETVHEAAQTAVALRSQLLDRRPVDSSGYIVNAEAPVEYSIEEDDLDQLIAALGIEFFDTDCSDSCRYVARNERWDEHFLDGASPDPNEYTQGMVLRGQWEHHSGLEFNVIREFDRADRRRVPFPRQGRDARYYRLGEINLIEFRLVGGEISLFLVDSPKQPDELTARLDNDLFQEWVDAMRSVSHYASVSYPPFDIVDSLDIGSALQLPIAIQTTTRSQVDHRGITFPTPIDLRFDRDDVSYTRGSLSTSYFRFKKPFLFFVIDHPTGSLLLLGRVADPISIDDWKSQVGDVPPLLNRP